FIISKLNLNSQVLFLVFSILTMFFLYKGIKYYSANNYFYKPVFYILMLIYTFFPSLNVVRQTLAAVIIFYGSIHIINRSFLKFLLWVFVASLFHSSSIVFIVMYFFINKNFRRAHLLILLFLSLLMANTGLIGTTLEYIMTNLEFLDFNNYL